VAIDVTPGTPEPAPPSSEAATIILTRTDDLASHPWPALPLIDPDNGPQLWLADQPGLSDKARFLPVDLPVAPAIVVGRSVNANVCLAPFDVNASISRTHARVRFLIGYFGLEDLGSVNGTWWNGQEVHQGERAPLRHGDTLVFGKLRAVFLVGPLWQLQHQPDPNTTSSPTWVLCPHCKHTTLGMFSFCSECGARFAGAAPATASLEVPVPSRPFAALPLSSYPAPPPPPTPLPPPPSSGFPTLPPLPSHNPPPAPAIPPVAEDLRSPLLDDQPARNDQLGFSYYCTALRDIILHPNTKTPLTLGILGRWGTGKTTLMHMLEQELKQRRLVTVWFNAWQYNKEDQLWAAFLQSLLNRIRADLKPLQRLRFDWRLLWARFDWQAAPEVALLYLVRALGVALPLVVAWPASLLMRQVVEAELVRWGGGLATAGLAGWLLLRPLLEAVRQNVKLDFGALRKESSYEKHIAFLDSFREHFQDVVQSLPVKGDKRLAVFVDDLDRCSPDGTLQVLDAIKLFLDIPGCVFVLGVDVDVVQKAVAGKYKDDPVAQQEYLGKIVQLPFYLPALSRRDTRHFVEQIVPQLPDGRCRSIFIEGLATNPREIKRAISVFAMLWSLAAHRPELSGIIKPVRLAKVVVIRHSYSALYKILEANPQFLIVLENYYRQAAKVVTATGAARPTLPKVLEPFAEVEGIQRMLLLYPPIEGVDDETSFARVKPEDIAVYFTLTQETPSVREAVPQPAGVYLPTFGERYEVRRLIGRGGMSSVYLAWDRQQQQSVAVKVVDPAIQTDPRTRARIQREIQILYRLDHPNIVRIYDNGVYVERDQELVYYAMEYLEGETLRTVLSRQQKLLPPEAFKLLGPVLEALAYIHNLGIIHRDLKPSAVGVTATRVPKLMDLGIARMLDEEKQQITQTGAPVGTPGYMAPEQHSSLPLDQRSDLYAFGVLFYECLTGRRPFVGATSTAELMQTMMEPAPDPRKFNPEISPALAKILLKLLEKQPQDRYHDALEVHRALADALKQ
jgi:hypothetical protein